jgi:hypothetical protein
MARFERESARADSGQDGLGAVTADLMSSVERQVEKVIEAAKERAAEIEAAAAARASELELETRHRSEQALELQVARLTAILDGIELLETTIAGMIGAWKSQIEELVVEVSEPLTDGGSTEQAEGAVPEPAKPVTTEAEPQKLAAESPEPAAAQPELRPASSAPRPLSEAVPIGPAADPSGAEQGNGLDEMIRSHVETMYEGGWPRAEAERFLTRFSSGEQYLAIVDEIYSRGNAPQTHRRGGLVSRIRRRSH